MFELGFFNIGEVFVTFSDEESSNQALRKHNQHIGSRYIEVYHANQEEFCLKYNLSQGVKMFSFYHILFVFVLNEIIIIMYCCIYVIITIRVRSNNCSIIIKMKGFSFDIMRPQIQQFLDQKKIRPTEIHIIYDRKNRNSGIAFLEFENESQCAEIFSLNRCYLGSRYINIYPSNVAELRMAIAEMMGSPLPRHIDHYTTCMKIENLPIDISHKHITRFFSQIDVCPKRLHIKLGSKIAYAEFMSPFDCQLALTMHDKQIQGVPIQLTQTTPRELQTVVGGLAGIDDELFIGGDSGSNSFNNTPYPTNSMSMSMSMNNNNNGNVNGSENECKSDSLAIGSNSNSNLNLNVNLTSKYDFNNTNNFCNNSSGHLTFDKYKARHGNDGNSLYPQAQCYNSNQNLFSYSNSHDMNVHTSMQGSSYQARYNTKSNNGWIVKLGGIPYQTTKEEIVNFFIDFPIDINCVRIFYDNRGRPRGEATVKFCNRQDAIQAIKKLDGKYIRDRYVLLTLLS